MDTNELMERIQRELGYQMEIPFTPPIMVNNTNEGKVVQEVIPPQSFTPVKSENQEDTTKDTEKTRKTPEELAEHMRSIAPKKGEVRNPYGIKGKRGDILKAMDNELEKIRSLNPDGTPGKTAAEVMAQNAIDMAVVDKNLDAIKWVTERKHGKVPNINQNTNVNVDINDILNEARGIKIVENLDTDDGEPTIVEVK